MATAQQVCTYALGLILNDDASSTPATTDLNLALETLQYLLDHWQLDPQATIGLKEYVYTPTAGTQSFTIGATGAVVMPMPQRLEEASFCRLGGVDFLIGLAASFEEYNSQPVKSNQGYPTKCWYNQDPVTNLGTLYLWPASNGAELHLWVRQVPLAGFSSMTLATTLVLPMGLQKALIDNLAMELLDSYNVPNPAYNQIKQKAALSLRKWKRSNLKINLLGMPMSIGRNTANSYTA